MSSLKNAVALLFTAASLVACGPTAPAEEASADALATDESALAREVPCVLNGKKYAHGAAIVGTKAQSGKSVLKTRPTLERRTCNKGRWEEPAAVSDTLAIAEPSSEYECYKGECYCAGADDCRELALSANCGAFPYLECNNPDDPWDCSCKQ